MTDLIEKELIREGEKRKLAGGFNALGDVIIYYNEVGDNGMSGTELAVARMIAGPKWRELKKTLQPVPSREVELPDPYVKTDYGGWERRYQDLFDQAGISYVCGQEAKHDWGRQEVERSVVIEHTLTPEQSKNFNPDRNRKTRLLYKVVDPEASRLELQITEVFPYFKPVKLGKTPFYHPTYTTSRADLNLFGRFKKLCSQVPLKDYDEFATVYMKLQHATEEYVLSSGNFIGQVGRIMKGFKVRADMQAVVGKKSNNGLLDAYKYLYNDPDMKMDEECRNQRVFEPRIPFKAYQRIMRKRCPLVKRPVESVLDTNDIFAMLIYWENVNPANFNLFRVNKDSSSGQWLTPQKKDESFLTDCIQAMNLLNSLEECVVEGRFSMEAYREFVSSQGSLFYPQTKNKEEVGSRDKLEKDKVWRNYFVFNSYTQMPAQILFGPSLKSTRAEFPLYKSKESPESWSLLGWSAYHGGLQNLIMQMSKEAMENGFSIAVYSDNLYVMHRCKGELWFYSLDGSSMEVSIEHADGKFFMRYIVTDYWGRQMTKGFQIYAEHLWPDISINGTALLANMQWQNIGQFSGQGGTAYVNNAKMILRATVLEYKLKSWPDDQTLLCDGTDLPSPESSQTYGSRVLHPKLDEAFSYGGISIKVELVTRSSLFGHFARDTIPEWTENHLVRLDLLGMDGIYLPWVGKIGGQYPFFPVLTDEKLFAGLAYSKIRGDYTDAERRILDIARLKAYYILGAWRYRPLAALIRDRIASRDTASNFQDLLISEKMTHNEIIEAQLMELAKEIDEPAAQAISIALDSFRLPYFYNVLSIYTDKTTARGFLLNLITEEGPTMAMAFADVKTIVGTIGYWLQNVVANEEEMSFREEVYEDIVGFLNLTMERDDTPETEGETTADAALEILNKIPKEKVAFIKHEAGLSPKLRAIYPKNEFITVPPSKRATSIRKDLGTISEFVDTVERLTPLQSFTSKEDKKKRVLKIITPQTKELLDKVIKTLIEKEIKIGQLHDYALYMKLAGITRKEMQAVIDRGEYQQFFLHLDDDLIRYAAKNLKQQSKVNPSEQFTRETQLRRFEKKERLRQTKEEKMAEALEEARVRKETVQQYNEGLRAERKAEKKKEKKKARKSESGGEQSPSQTQTAKVALAKLISGALKAGEGKPDLEGARKAILEVSDIPGIEKTLWKKMGNNNVDLPSGPTTLSRYMRNTSDIHMLELVFTLSYLRRMWIHPTCGLSRKVGAALALKLKENMIPDTPWDTVYIYSD